MKEPLIRDITVRATDTLYNKIRERANSETISINKWITSAIENKLAPKPPEIRQYIKLPAAQANKKLHDAFYLSMQLIKEQSDLIEKLNLRNKSLELDLAWYRGKFKEAKDKGFQ